MTRLLLLAVVFAGCAAPRPAVQQGPAVLTTPTIPVAGAELRTGAPLQSQAPLGAETSAPSVRGQTGGLHVIPAAASPTPRPSGGIGKPASYCKPGYCETPEPALRGSEHAGEATWWYSFGPGIYAALRPDLGSKGDLVIVCGGEPFHCVTAPVITSCACLGPNSDRLVDLSADLFREFAPLSAGVVRITLQVVTR